MWVLVGTCGLRLVTEGVLISVMHVSTGAVNARGSENTFSPQSTYMG